jgi:hypothetical protein
MVSQTSKEIRMYKDTMQEIIKSAEAAATKPIERYGVSAYFDSDPDWCGADIFIDPKDEKGIAICREFAAKIAEHYKTIDNGSGNQAGI